MVNFIKYMNEGDTYKFIDEEKTYRVMSNIKDLREYFSLKMKIQY